MIDLSDSRELGALTQLVAAIRSAEPARELLLVGATARDLHLWHVHRIAIERATFDLDFAVAVADWEEFDSLRRRLLASGAFAETQGNQHRLVLGSTIKLDLIPFGGVERADRSIAWPPAGDEVMQLIGYREAMRDSMTVRLPDGHIINVVTLPALALLKLFAWQDRRTRSPGKDAKDLGSVLQHFLAAGNDERLYADFGSLLDSPDYDYLQAGAWMLGNDIRTLLSIGDDAALGTATNLLSREIDPDGDLHLATDMGVAKAEQNLGLLTAMHAGLSGRASPWK